MRVQEREVAGGASFHVAYELKKGDENRLSLSPVLRLSKDEKVLNQLLVRDVGGVDEYPAVLTPSDPMPTLSLTASPGRFYRYELPDLEPGTYGVCEDYRLAGQDGTVCSQLTVV